MLIFQVLLDINTEERESIDYLFIENAMEANNC